MRRILSAFGKLLVVALLAVAFAFGLLATVYLSLRSPSINVPDVVNKSYVDGQSTLGEAGLDIRERAQRYKPDVAPGVILDQSPRAGEVVKAGQTIAVVVSRAPKEGEKPPSEEVAEERREDEKRGTRTELTENANRNENSNRRRASNRNANANQNANAGANTNTSANRNATGSNTRNTNQGNANLPSNRNANRGANTNANRSRNANTTGGRGSTNTGRPANTNRRPNP